ncbi:MAG: response regulator, partial [Defluviitaleaceae bacterium]|nr:response regulator [Defluviitaleaceae bacterium]
MIIDNNANFRRYIKKIINWPAYGYTEITDVSGQEENLRDIFAQKPALVLLDSIEILQKSREDGYAGNIIFISRHSGVTQAQKAICFGIEAYLKRPFNKREMAEAIDRINKKSGGQNVRIYNLLTGRASAPPSDADRFQVAVARFANSENRDNFLTSLRENTGTYSDFAFSGDILVLLLSGRALMQHFKRFICENGSAYELVSAALSSETSSVADLPHLYDEADYAIRNFFYYAENPTLLECADIDLCKQQPGECDAENIEAIYQRMHPHLIGCEISEITREVNNFEDMLRGSGYTVQKITSLCIKLLHTVNRHIGNLYPDSVSNSAYEDALTAIGSSGTLKQAVSHILRHLSTISNSIGTSEHRHIAERLCDYIDRHYTQPIKLSGLAAEFNYNSAYLGRI